MKRRGDDYYGETPLERVTRFATQWKNQAKHPNSGIGETIAEICFVTDQPAHLTADDLLDIVGRYAGIVDFAQREHSYLRDLKDDGRLTAWGDGRLSAVKRINTIINKGTDGNTP